MELILIIIVILLLFGGGVSLPHWGYHNYGYGPSLLMTILLIVLIVYLVRHQP